MKTHFNNQGEPIDPPRPVMPCQSLEERMSGSQAVEPIVPGQLSQQHRKILSQSETPDRREFDHRVASGQGFAEAFKVGATSELDEEVNALCRTFGVSFIKAAGPKPFRVERDVLTSGEISVSEYDEDGRLLRGWVSADGEPPAEMRR